MIVSMVKRFLILLIILLSIVSCEKEISTTQLEEEAGKAQIKITSYPAALAIYKNGRNTGSFTTDSLTFLSEGNYEITLKKNLFADSSFVVTLGKDEKKSIFIDYSTNPKMYGNIYCESKPDKAEIYLNGKSTGLSTPNTIKKLWPGDYRITYKHATAYEDSLIITVQSNKTVKAAKELADTSVWVAYNKTNKQFPSDYLTAVDIDASGKLWIGTLDNGVISLLNNHKEIFTIYNSPLPSNFITDIEVASNNEVWVGTGDGLASIINGVWTVYNSSNSVLKDNYITSVEKFGNNLWVGTSNGLIVYEMDKGLWTIYDWTNSQIPHPSVSCIGMDSEGTIWFGTNGFGIVRFTRVWDDVNNKYVESWLHFKPEDIPNNPGKSISAIGIDPNGSRWFGHLRTQYEKGGVTNLGASLRNIEWQVYFNNFVQDTYFEKIYFEGSIKWICTNTGVIYFQYPNNLTTLRSDNSSMPNSNVRDMCFASNKVVYFASFGGGLIKYKRK